MVFVYGMPNYIFLLMTQSYHILLVEDDINLSTVLADYLQSKGYQVETASDGKEAWEMLSQKHLEK